MFNSIQLGKTIFVLLTLVLFSSVQTFAQPGFRYSTSDKKAIKLYEEAVRAYELGLKAEAVIQIEKAIEKDSRFSEAYLLRAQLNSDAGDMKGAINDLRAVTTIDGKGFPTTYFFLGDLLMRDGDYADARNQFVAFRKMQLGNPVMDEKADLMIESCDFAVAALNNPVPFEPKNMGPSINTDRPEYFPCITADSKTFLFTRLVEDRRVRGGQQEDFFVSNWNNGWSPSAQVGEINTPFNEGAPTLSADGQMLVYTACEAMGGDWGSYTGLGSCDLFISQNVGGRWGKPINLRGVNSYDWDSQPSFSADGKTLYFVRGKNTGQGIQEQDIYFSELDMSGQWTRPKRIPGKVNTNFEEESVLIHPDGNTLYFSSNGHPGMGGLDIFMSRLMPDGTWGEPINLGYPINTGGDENSLLVSADGETAYFASDREGGYGGLDLYEFVLPESVRPEAVSYVEGTVFDASSKEKLQARLELIDLESGRVIVESYSDPVSGKFLVVLPPGKEYALNVARPQYLFYSDHFSLTEADVSEPFLLDVPMNKMKEGSRIVLNNVFFDTDSYVLKEQSKVELDRLVVLLRNTNGLVAEIGGHTDNVGSDESNQVLSENRAKSVVDYLVSKGIPSTQITAKGYGETQPVATNDTPEGRAKNRRTEMKILE